METSSDVAPAVGRPSLATPSSFHSFPRLPLELQLVIWREAASIPRVVNLELTTAHERSLQFTKHGQLNHDLLYRKIPHMLHATHHARQEGLRIYRHRFALRCPCCPNGPWETYILADHDILAMDEIAFHQLVVQCKPKHAEWDNFLTISPQSETYDWLDKIVREGRQSTQEFKDIITPDIRWVLESLALERLSIAFLRGDLESINHLTMYRTSASVIWPGLYRDDRVLTNLERAFSVITDYHAGTPFEDFSSRLSGAGVTTLPSSSRCRILSCPRHPGHCDWKQPAIAVARMPLDMGQWLNSCAGDRVIAKDAGYNTVDWEEPELGTYDMVLWRFRQPRYGIGMAEGPNDRHFNAVEILLGAYQVVFFGVNMQVIPVYPRHVGQPCEWAVPDSKQLHQERQPEEPLSELPAETTPGCLACLEEEPSSDASDSF